MSFYLTLRSSNSIKNYTTNFTVVPYTSLISLKKDYEVALAEIIFEKFNKIELGYLKYSDSDGIYNIDLTATPGESFESIVFKINSKLQEIFFKNEIKRRFSIREFIKNDFTTENGKLILLPKSSDDNDPLLIKNITNAIKIPKLNLIENKIFHFCTSSIAKFEYKGCITQYFEDKLNTFNNIFPNANLKNLFIHKMNIMHLYTNIIENEIYIDDDTQNLPILRSFRIDDNEHEMITYNEMNRQYHKIDYNNLNPITISLRESPDTDINLNRGQITVRLHIREIV